MSRAPRPLRWLLVAALLVTVVVPVSAVAQQAEQERLSEAREQLARIADELDEATSELDDVEQELEDADERLAEVEAIVNEVAADVERQRAAVGDAQRRVDRVETEAAELAEAFEDRVARLYKQGPELTFETFMSSEGTDEAIARTVLLERVTEGDQVDLERLDAAATTVQAERERLRDEQRELEGLLDEQQAVLAEAEELRESRALAAADARARVEGLDQEHDDLEDEEAELEELVRQRQEEERQRREEEERRRRAEEQRAAEEAAAAERQAEREAEQQAEREATREAEQQAEREAEPQGSSDGGSSGTSSGAAESTPSTAGGGGGGSGHAWPLCAPVTSEYGPRWGRTHRGIDQGASPGTPIGASRGGTVIFAGWQGGYGNLTLIDHGDGVVTAYAHQTSFAVGQGTQVSQGQTIGYVGNTGNSTGPHLHFETRVNGTAVNPRQYLSGSPC